MVLPINSVSVTPIFPVKEFPDPVMISLFERKRNGSRVIIGMDAAGIRLVRKNILAVLTTLSSTSPFIRSVSRYLDTVVRCRESSLDISVIDNPLLFLASSSLILAISSEFPIMSVVPVLMTTVSDICRRDMSYILFMFPEMKKYPLYPKMIL